MTFPGPQPGGGVSAAALNLVASQTVSGSAVSSVTFSGLDLDAASNYMVCWSLKNAGFDTNLQLIFNGDAAILDYTSKSVQYANGSVLGYRGAISAYCGITYNGCYGWGHICCHRGVDGYTYATCASATDVVGADLYGSVVKKTDINVTSIKIKCESGDAAIGVGSQFKLYRYG